MRSLLVLGLILVTCTARAQGPSDALEAELGVAGGLHASDVVRAAIETSRERAVRRAEIEAAYADADRALLSLVPRLELSASYTRLSEITAPSLGYIAVPAGQTQPGPIPPGAPLVAVPLQFPVLLDQTALRAQLVVPLSDYFLRVLPSRDAAQHAARAGEAQLEVTEQAVALEAETLYWSWARAHLTRLVAAQALERAEAHRDDAGRLHAAGVGVEADVTRAQAQVAEMQALLATTANVHAAIGDRLRTIMHVARIPETIGDELPEEADTIALEAAVDRALGRRSELRAIDAQISALEAQRTIQDAAWAPRLDLFGELLLADPNPRFVPQQERFDGTWAVGARVSWQLADAIAAEPARRALEARIAAARAMRELATEGIRAEVVDARRAHADAQSSVASRRAAVDAAERTLHQVTDVYRAGRGTGLPVIDAQTLLVRTRLDWLSARIDLAIAAARLRRALETTP